MRNLPLLDKDPQPEYELNNNTRLNWVGVQVLLKDNARLANKEQVLGDRLTVADGTIKVRPCKLLLAMSVLVGSNSDAPG